jgi:hypothetical protein
MVLQKENLLVQLSVGDLKQLIKEAINEELQKLKEVIQLNPKNSENESELLSREATAKMLGVSTTTLFFWNRDSILKAKKIGRRVYYLKSEVLSKIRTAS